MEEPFVYDAGLLCLDLANTVVAREGRAVDLLTDANALRRWLAGAGLGAGDESDDSRARRQAFRTARELRAAVRTIAEAMIAGDRITDDAVSVVNRVLEARPTFDQVVREEDGFRRVSRTASRTPLALLTPVAASAARLLTGLDPARVSRCDARGCVLVYYDASRNRSRRWCSMARCGNRAKVARHYRRSRR